MRSRSPLCWIQPCRRTIATTMCLLTYSKSLLASTLLKRKARYRRREELTSTFKVLVIGLLEWTLLRLTLVDYNWSLVEKLGHHLFCYDKLTRSLS